jgi:hypothetical protein
MLALLVVLRKNWKLALVGAALVLAIGVYFYVGHLQSVARAQKVRLEQASRNAEIQSVTAKAVDQVAVTTAKTEEHSHVVIQRIQAAAGADTPVPAAVLEQWRVGLSDDDTGSSDYSSGKPASPLR